MTKGGVMKKFIIPFLLVLIIYPFSTSFAIVTLPYFDGYEEYPAVSLPAGPWETLAIRGRISNTESHTGYKSMAVSSRVGSHQSGVIDLGEHFPDKIAYEAWVKVPTADTGVIIGFMEQIGGMAPAYNAVHFGNGGSLQWNASTCNVNRSRPIGSYRIGFWEHIRVELDFSSETGKVIYNHGERIENVDIVPKNVCFGYPSDTYFNLRHIGAIGYIGEDVYIDDFSVASLEEEDEENNPLKWGISITWPEDLLECNQWTEIGKIKEAIDKTKQLGGKWFRMHVRWRDIEPEITNKNLFIPGTINNQMLDDYYNDTKYNWEKYDKIVNYANKKGVNIVFIVGTGFILPFNFLPDYNGNTITVDGFPFTYIACVELHAKAVARKYGNVVRLWQLENELNTASLQVIDPWWRWRANSLQGGFNWSQDWFLLNLLSSLSSAVKSENGKVYTNFHIFNLLPISAWSLFLDYIGLDIYWDKYCLEISDTNPLCQDVKTNNINSLMATASLLSFGKPLLIAEVGYNINIEQYPLYEEEQADWIEETAIAAQNFGAIGYFYWTINTTQPGCEAMGLIRKNPFNQQCEPKSGYYRYRKIIAKDSADLFRDGEVGPMDYFAIRTRLGACRDDSFYLPRADYDNDGCITYADYRIWYNYYRLQLQ